MLFLWRWRWDGMGCQRAFRDLMKVIWEDKRSVSYPEALRLCNIGIHLTLHNHNLNLYLLSQLWNKNRENGEEYNTTLLKILMWDSCRLDIHTGFGHNNKQRVEGHMFKSWNSYQDLTGLIRMMFPFLLFPVRLVWVHFSNLSCYNKLGWQTSCKHPAHESSRLL